MQTKDFLNQAKYLQQKIDRQQDQIKLWESLSYSVSSPQFDKIRVDCTRSNDAPFLKWIYKILDMESIIEKEMIQLNKCKQRTKEAVSTYIDDEDAALVIIKRYVDLLPFEQISKDLCMRNSTMYRLHREGIELLSKGEPYETNDDSSQN